MGHTARFAASGVRVDTVRRKIAERPLVCTVKRAASESVVASLATAIRHRKSTEATSSLAPSPRIVRGSNANSRKIAKNGALGDISSSDSRTLSLVRLFFIYDLLRNSRAIVRSSHEIFFPPESAISGSAPLPVMTTVSPTLAFCTAISIAFLR